VPTQEMRALWHPTRAQILELLKAEPATRSRLVEAAGAPYAEVAYHCRALCRSGCIQYAASSGPHAADPLFEAV
jgi:DNA-binding transcriptional ArsR family regulator